MPRLALINFAASVSWRTMPFVVMFWYAGRSRLPRSIVSRSLVARRSPHGPLWGPPENAFTASYILFSERLVLVPNTDPMLVGNPMPLTDAPFMTSGTDVPRLTPLSDADSKGKLSR